MKKLLYAMVLGTTLCNAGPGDTLTIDNCMKIAAERKSFARQKRNSEAIYQNKVRNLNTNWYPAAGLYAQASYNSEAIDFSDVMQNLPTSIPSVPLDQYKLWTDINQQLYDGGMNKALKDLEHAGWESDMVQTDIELLGIQLQINQVYFALLQTMKNHEILKLSLDELTTQKEMVRSGVKFGIMLQDNLLAMEAEEISLFQKLTETELQKNQMLSILGILMDTTITPFQTFIEPDEPTLNESEKRPEFLLFDIQKKSLDANKELIASSEMPKIYAFMQLAYGRPGYNMISDDFHTFYSVGAGFKWNFLNYGENRRQKKIIEYQKDIVEIKRENFTNQLDIQLQSELTNQAKYDSMICHDEKILRIRKEITASSLSKLKNGVMTSSDYLRDMNAEILARLQLEAHKILKRQAAYSYLLLQGKIY